MRYVLMACLLLLPLATAGQASDADKEALIELDKEWGSAQGAAAAEVVGRIAADDVIAVSGEGVAGKAELIANSQAAEAPAGPYAAKDYQLRFLDETTAVMTHSAAEPDPHWSLHVWKKQDGVWKVIATMSTPISE